MQDVRDDPRWLDDQREMVAKVLDTGQYKGHEATFDEQWACLGAYATIIARLYVHYGWMVGPDFPH